MGMPSKLKNLNIFLDGNTMAGVATSLTPAKLTRKMEAFRAGGMGGAAHVDFGLDDDALKVEWTCGGYVRELLKQMGASTVDGVQLRFMGAYQRDDTNEVDSVEIVIRGRHAELDRGESKVGEDTEWKISTNCVYYKETLNGEVIVEHDIFNLISMIGGVDTTEGIRRATGM